MPQKQVQQNVFHFNEVMCNILQEEKQWVLVLQLYDAMGATGVIGDVTLRNSARRLGNWPLALSLGIEEVVGTTALLKSVGSGTAWSAALNLLALASARRLSDGICFNAAADSCSGIWPMAFHLCQVDAFGLATAACAAEAGEAWRMAWQLEAKAQALGLEIGLFDRPTLPPASQSGNRPSWQQTLQRWQAFQRSNGLDASRWHEALHMRGGNANTLLTVAARAADVEQQWEFALCAFLNSSCAMSGTRLANSVATACARRLQWAEAFRFLGSMPLWRMEPRAAGFNAAISASATSRHWMQSFWMVRRMLSQKLIPDEISFGTLLDSVAEDWRHEAFEVLMSVESSVAPWSPSFLPWAMAKLRLRPAPARLVHAFAAALRGTRCRAADVVALAWAAATLCVYSRPLAQKVATDARQCMADFSNEADGFCLMALTGATRVCGARHLGLAVLLPTLACIKHLTCPGCNLRSTLSFSSFAPSILGNPVVLDRLCHGWSIHQLQNGYRFNGDDILLAREASREASRISPSRVHLLDLGAGTGSVGLFWLAQGMKTSTKLSAKLTALEAQEESVELLRRTVDLLHLKEAVRVVHGDLRDEDVVEKLGPFDLITANPPYIAPEDKKLPEHSQRRFCYYELRGGLHDFAMAAAKMLKRDGKFCIVHVHRRGDDVWKAVQAAGFVPQRRLTALARGQAKWQVLICGRSGAEFQEQELVVRDHQGRWTKEWDGICAEMGAFQKPSSQSGRAKKVRHGWSWERAHGCHSSLKDSRWDVAAMRWELRVLAVALQSLNPQLLPEIWAEVARRLETGAWLTSGSDWQDLLGVLGARPLKAREPRAVTFAPGGAEPQVLLDLSDRVVVFKPVGWEVYNDHGHMQLIDFVRAKVGDLMIFRDPSRDMGFLHRLDVPSSGLLLAAKGYEAHADLQLQLHTGQLQREYIVLCHGFLPDMRRLIDARLWDLTPLTEAGLGKAASTRMKVASYVHFPAGALALTVVMIRIDTGRKHQIRSRVSRQLFSEALAQGGLACFFRLIEQFHTQGEPAYCGLGTLAMVMNALGVDPERVWKGPWRWFSESLLDCCEPLETVKERGITFSKVACLARCNGAHVEAHRADEPDVSLEDFRRAVRKTCEADPEDENFQVIVALLADPLPQNASAAAAEVIRRALRFIESPQMPLTVVYKVPEGQSDQEVVEVAKALGRFGDGLNRALGDECFGIEDVGDTVEELGPNRVAASVLAIEPSLWQQALGTDVAAQAAWEVLRPLLLDFLQVLKKDIFVLQQQWADLLTAREEMCGIDIDCASQQVASGGMSRSPCLRNWKLPCGGCLLDLLDLLDPPRAKARTLAEPSSKGTKTIREYKKN
ncbi:unnamed protein product [Durusdinium trenchii]